MHLLPVNGEGQKQNFLPGVAVSARAVTPPLAGEEVPARVAPER